MEKLEKAIEYFEKQRQIFEQKRNIDGPTFSPRCEFYDIAINAIKTKFKEEKAAAQVELFNIFWKEYPKKTDRPAALRAFKKINPDSQLFKNMLAALEFQKKTPQWEKDGGQFIPYPSTWLNGWRWEEFIQEKTELEDDIIQKGMKTVPIFKK